MKQSAFQLTSLILLSVAAALTSRALAEDKSAPTVQTSRFAKALAGTWVLVGKPGEIGEAPATGGRLQIYSGRHWLITQADPKSGVVIFHHGGTFTLTGDELVKTVEYANENTAALIKESHKFRLTVEGDTLTQIGIDNPFSEVWRRVK